MKKNAKILKNFYKSKWDTRCNQFRLLFTDECPIKKAICQKLVTISIYKILKRKTIVIDLPRIRKNLYNRRRN